jgi:hypothetical protein
MQRDMRPNIVYGCRPKLTENRHVFYCSYQLRVAVSIAK